MKNEQKTYKIGIVWGCTGQIEPKRLPFDNFGSMAHDGHSMQRWLSIE